VRFDQLIDFGSIRFGEPLYLWLLAAPAVLFLLWCVQVVRRRSDARRYRAARLVPVHERFGAVGELAFWLALIAALSLTILALARPQGITAIVRSPGVDIVLLMDGSTSMRVRDMGTDRWQRAMQWVRTFTKTLSWNGDRMALATFADIAVPQVRLTRDPNTILFFLDHLDDAPTFRLENETSWNTNVEDAIYWGVKLVETDQEMYGPSKNARTFVVISDGQVWSGNVQRAIAAAAQRGISVDVIGVGTSNGGMIPLPRDDKGVVLAGFEPIRSMIDRTSLREIARAGNGEYFEIGAAADEQIAARIIQNASRRSGNEVTDEALDELYWYLLAGAAGCIAAGVLFVKQRLQLGFGFAVALALLALISSLRS
jgi:Ca-activated chloride channel family protein